MLPSLLAFVTSTFRTRLSMQAEILALRHQLAVYQNSKKRPRLKPADRLLWVWLSRIWPRWREALVIVQPGTVIRWQRKRFRDHWAKLSQRQKPGRPRIAKKIRELIRNVQDVDGHDFPRLLPEPARCGGAGNTEFLGDGSVPGLVDEFAKPMNVYSLAAHS